MKAEKKPNNSSQKILQKHSAEDGISERNTSTHSSAALRHRIFQVNRIKTTLLLEGESLEDLARRTEVSYSRIRKYNEVIDEELLNPGMQVFLQPKRNKGTKKFHKVEDGQSWFEISQIYGVKLKHLYRRNRCNGSDQPAIGAKVWLRSKRSEPIATRKKYSDAYEKDMQAWREKYGEETMQGNNDRDNSPESDTSPKSEERETDEPLAVFEQPVRPVEKASPEKEMISDVGNNLSNEILNSESADEADGRRYFKPSIGKPSIEVIESEEIPDTVNYRTSEMDKSPTIQEPVGDGREAMEIESKKEDKESFEAWEEPEMGHLFEKKETKTAGVPGESVKITEHRVNAGDTLYNISKRYGVSVDELKKWNKLSDNTIKLGQVLLIKSK